MPYQRTFEIPSAIIRKLVECLTSVFQHLVEIVLILKLWKLALDRFLQVQFLNSILLTILIATGCLVVICLPNQFNSSLPLTFKDLAKSAAADLSNHLVMLTNFYVHH